MDIRHFPLSKLPILLGQLSCSGKESSLARCNYSTTATTCDHTEDVGVLCLGAQGGGMRI